MAEWSIATVLKTDDCNRSGGSNPSSSAKSPIIGAFFMACFVYILYSEEHDSYYIGQTNDVSEWLKRHNLGMEKATARYAPWKLILSFEKASRSEAVVLERKIKNLNRQRLLQLIEKYSKPE